MPNHDSYTYVTFLIPTPLELKDWANRVEFTQDRLTELTARVLNSPNFKDYLEEEQGKQQVLALTKIYDPGILTFAHTDFLLATGIYNIFSSLLERSILIEVDNSAWINVNIRRMSMSNVEIELYF